MYHLSDQTLIILLNVFFLYSLIDWCWCILMLKLFRAFNRDVSTPKNEARITWMVIFVNVLFTNDLFCHDRWRSTLMMRDCTRPSVMPTLHQSAEYLSLHWGCRLTLDYKPHPWLGFVWLQPRLIVGLSDYSQLTLILIQCDYAQVIGICLILTNFDRWFQETFEARLADSSIFCSQGWKMIK